MTTDGPGQPLGGPHGDEEEIRHGSDRVPTRLRRPATVVLVAVAGLAVAWVTTRLEPGDDTAAGPSSSMSAMSAVPSSPSSPFVVPGPSELPVSVVPASDVPIPQRAPTCPAGVQCRTVSALPGAVTAALRDNYPGARVLSSRTITRSVDDVTMLVGRSITAVAGARRFRIEVGPYVMGPDSFDRSAAGRVSTVGVDSATGDQTVHLLLTEPRTARPNDLIVVRLARDPRLSALR